MTASLIETSNWIAFFKVIWVNILLSGDNAVVIALSCRALEHRQRRTAIIFGTVLAIGCRIAFTGVASLLLSYSYVKLAGSVLLFWIALKFMLPEKEDDGRIDGCNKLFAAVKTIVIADVVMSLDNVIGVAAAAKGSFNLLVLGLLTSMPIVIFGSTLILKLLVRFPSLVALGAGLLGYIAGELALSETSVNRWIGDGHHFVFSAGPVAVALSVVAIGKTVHWVQANRRDLLYLLGRYRNK